MFILCLFGSRLLSLHFSVFLIVKSYISKNIYCICASLCVYVLCVCTRAGARERVYVSV